MLNGALYVARSAALKLWMLNRAELTVKDGTESSHLSQLHLFHCWLHCLGQLIYGSLTNSSLTMEQQAAVLFTSSHSKMARTRIREYNSHTENISWKYQRLYQSALLCRYLIKSRKLYIFRSKGGLKNLSCSLFWKVFFISYLNLWWWPASLCLNRLPLYPELTSKYVFL